MTQAFDLRRSQALWNREGLDLASDEILAQILDLGELEAWREIYRRAAAPTDEGAALRRRIVRPSRRRCERFMKKREYVPERVFRVRQVPTCLGGLVKGPV